MSEGFWNTLMQPTIHGNSWALAVLFLSQAALAWRFYKANVPMAIFCAVIASANFTRLVEGWRI